MGFDYRAMAEVVASVERTVASRWSHARDCLRGYLQKSYALREESDSAVHPKSKHRRFQRRLLSASDTAMSMVRDSFAMCCQENKDLIGRFLDDELAPDARAEISEHFQSCSACSLELTSLRKLTSEISASSDVGVPSGLWDSIERRLATEADCPAERIVTGDRPLRTRRWALAASLAFVAGLGMLGLSLMDNSARASTINFGILLDGLPLDAREAFRKFIALYDGQPGSPLDARKFAPALEFDTPTTLPGGFRLDSVYLLQFGERPGVAASYMRGGEFLATIFHAPVTIEDFGTHKDYACVVGKHHGHMVEIGSWKMVHLTDATTCHCVLSQLDESSELPAVMAAIAPSASTAHAHRHDE